MWDVSLFLTLYDDQMHFQLAQQYQAQSEAQEIPQVTPCDHRPQEHLQSATEDLSATYVICSGFHEGYPI